MNKIKNVLLFLLIMWLPFILILFSKFYLIYGIDKVSLIGKCIGVHSERLNTYSTKYNVATYEFVIDNVKYTDTAINYSCISNSDIVQLNVYKCFDNYYIYDKARTESQIITLLFCIVLLCIPVTVITFIVKKKTDDFTIKLKTNNKSKGK